jgi:effector-binding domain-containing protein
MMGEIRITEQTEQRTAGIREKVTAVALTEFFARAFAGTLSALAAEGLYPYGAPYGKYYGRVGSLLDVEAGFPVAATIEDAGGVRAGTLPGGRIVEADHHGSYDSLEDTYAAIERFCSDSALKPAPVMWERYLVGPDSESDPAKWLTRVCQPVR